MSVIMNYYRHMDRSGIQFDFLCFIPCEDSHEGEINKLGGRVFFISKPHASLRSLREIQAFFRAHRGEYSWFHNHEVYLSALLKPIAAHYGIKGFIVHSHATQYSDHKLAAVRNQVLCMPIRFMGCHRFACSKAAGAFLFGKRAVRSGKVHILYNAIDTEKFRYDPQKRKEVREELGIAEGTFVIGHVGRFVPQKNHVFLLKVFKAFLLYRPDVTLLLIGDGPLLQYVATMGKEMGINDKILYTGYIKNIADFYHSMDIMVMPSLYEGFPCTCIEAQANGLPCILSNTVTKEVCISKNVGRLPIQAKYIALWVQAIMKFQNTSRASSGTIDKRMRARGFKISSASKLLENFYLGAGRCKH